MLCFRGASERGAARPRRRHPARQSPVLESAGPASAGRGVPRQGLRFTRQRERPVVSYAGPWAPVLKAFFSEGARDVDFYVEFLNVGH